MWGQIQPISLNRSIIDGSPLDPPTPPHVQPSFYAALLVDSFVGTHGSSFPFSSSTSSATSGTRIVELDVGADNVSGYAAFEGGELVRAVLVNLDAWLASQAAVAGAVRPNVTVTLSPSSSPSANSGLKTKKVQVRRLEVGHADDTAGLTWAGQSYEASNDASPTGKVVIETLSVGKDGSVEVTVRASEAVLVTFGG